MNRYPELEKLSAIQEQSQTMGLFLEWLFQNIGTLCKWQDAKYYDDGGDLLESGKEHLYRDVEPSGYYPVRLNIEQILALYFNIDMDKVNREKDHILQELRNRNERK